MNDNKRKLKNFAQFISLSLILMSLLACQKDDASDNYDILQFSDDTTKAADLVADANEDLNKIKIMYKKNETQSEELKSAMSGQDIEKVKAITANLVGIINDGTVLGEEALKKIEAAEAMNINADFKDYLSLKAQSLQKQLDAFEHRRQAIRLLKESFGTNDKTAIMKGQAAFIEQEENAQKILAEAKEISEKANNLAKESAKKTVN